MALLVVLWVDFFPLAGHLLIFAQADRFHNFHDQSWNVFGRWNFELVRCLIIQFSHAHPFLALGHLQDNVKRTVAHSGTMRQLLSKAWATPARSCTCGTRCHGGVPTLLEPFELDVIPATFAAVPEITMLQNEP